MQVSSLINKKEIYVLKGSFFQTEKLLNKILGFSIFSAHALEIIAIVLICAILFGAMFFWTMRFLDFLVLFVRQMFSLT